MKVSFVTQLITTQEQAELAKLAKAVHYRYCRRSHDVQLEVEDLLHLGVIALLEARKTFDAEKGDWLPFLRLRARGAMLDDIRRQAPVSQDDYQKVRQLEAARQSLQREGIAPDEQALAARLGWQVAEVSSWRRQLPMLVPALNAEGDDEENPHGRVLVSGDLGPAELTLRKEMWQIVSDCLASLPSPDLRLILESRTLHGLGLKELAASFACTMESIRLKQKKAAAWVRECLERKGWPEAGWQSVLDAEGDT